MRDHENAMLTYVRLADLSQQKRQPLGRDKFLMLTGAAACRAGWPQVAHRCRELVLSRNRVHLIGRFETFADALRDPQFQPFLKQVERFCTYEKAEHLLQELNVEPGLPRTEPPPDAGEFAMQILNRPHWSRGPAQKPAEEVE